MMLQIIMAGSLNAASRNAIPHCGHDLLHFQLERLCLLSHRYLQPRCPGVWWGLVVGGDPTILSFPLLGFWPQFSGGNCAVSWHLAPGSWCRYLCTYGNSTARWWGAFDGCDAFVADVSHTMYIVMAIVEQIWHVESFCYSNVNSPLEMENMVETRSTTHENLLKFLIQDMKPSGPLKWTSPHHQFWVSILEFAGRCPLLSLACMPSQNQKITVEKGESPALCT